MKLWVIESPKGEGWGEGEATLEAPMRLRTADELNNPGTVRTAIQGRAPRTTQRVGSTAQRRAILPLLGGDSGSAQRRGEGGRLYKKATPNKLDRPAPPALVAGRVV